MLRDDPTKFDIVLTDVGMPFPGDRLLEQIKSSEALSDIPVIVMSSIDYSELIESGATAFFPKNRDLADKIFTCVQALPPRMTTEAAIPVYVLPENKF